MKKTALLIALFLLITQTASATIFEFGLDFSGYVVEEGSNGLYAKDDLISLKSQFFINTSKMEIAPEWDRSINGDFISGFLQIDDRAFAITPNSSYFSSYPTDPPVNETYICFGTNDGTMMLGILNGIFVFGDFSEQWWTSQPDPFSEYLIALVGRTSFSGYLYHSQSYGTIYGAATGYCSVYPVPEPSTLILLAIGTTAISARRRYLHPAHRVTP